MYDLRALRPFTVSDKIRLGKDGDGGYIVTKRLVDATHVLLSFGISDDWSFEEDLDTRKRVTAYLYDIVVSHRWHLQRVLAKAKLLKPLATFRMVRIWLAFTLFILRPRVFYRQIGIAHTPRAGFLDFANIFASLRQKHNLSTREVLVKMDIEGGEYEVITDLEPYLPLVAGIILEVHELAERGAEFDRMVRFLREHDFYPCHIHGNNLAPLIPGSHLPSVLELTFLHEQFFPNGLKPDMSPYPHPDLDFANDPMTCDFVLRF